MSTLRGAGSGASCCLGDRSSFTTQYLSSEIFQWVQQDGLGENPSGQPGKPDLRGRAVEELAVVGRGRARIGVLTADFCLTWVFHSSRLQ